MSTPVPLIDPTTQAKLRGTKTLLIGGIGSGKTHSLRTCVDAGLTLFVLATEPGIEEVLGDIPDAKLHWHYLPPFAPSWEDLEKTSRMINQLSYDGLSNIKGGILKEKCTQFLEVYRILSNFPCDRCGQKFGPVDSWGLDRTLAWDSLSGLSIMSKDLMIGMKPTAHQGEWGVSMDNLARAIRKACFDISCHFILTAHTEREPDEISGRSKIMVSTLGKKLAPEVPKYFSDVIYCKRMGKSWHWDTLADDMDTKARNVPWATSVQPSFVPLIQAWKHKTGYRT